MKCFPILLLVTPFAVTACSSSDPLTTPEPITCEAEDASACRVNQLACQLDGTTPSCFSCSSGEYADAAGTCATLGTDPLSHEFPEQTVEPGGESVGLCRSWTLGNAEPIYVNAVELEQDESSHHSNWLFVPEGNFDGPDGIWPCSERGYSQLGAAVVGGVLYAQSTQATRETQKFPDGVVIRLPPNARIISDIHTLNSSSSDVTGNSNVTLYSLAPDEVTVELVPFHLTYDGLHIPPQSTSRFTGECDLEKQFQQNTKKPLDMKVYYMLPHTHALGTRMFVEAMGGAIDGQTLIDVRGFNGEARGRSYDPPIDLNGATGLRFGCEFENPRAESVGWGFDDQEMCETLGFAATPIAFESRVDTAESSGDDNGIATFSGDCSTISFLWQ